MPFLYITFLHIFPFVHMLPRSCHGPQDFDMQLLLREAVSKRLQPPTQEVQQQMEVLQHEVDATTRDAHQLLEQCR